MNLLKAACLLIYAIALAGWAGVLPGLLPGALTYTMQVITVVFIATHVIELFFVFKRVRLYRGPLAVSVLLTLLFGVLHWKPLGNQATKEAAGR